MKISEDSSALPETMEGPNEEQNPPDPNNPIGSAAAWTPCGQLVRGGNIDCKGITAQAFLCFSPEAPTSSCFMPLCHIITHLAQVVLDTLLWES